MAKPPTNAIRRLARNHAAWLEFSGLMRNPENIPLSTYERMLDTDETCKAGLEFLALGIASALGRYVNPNKRAQAFVDSMFAPVDGARVSLGQIVDELCHAFAFGFAVAENSFRFDGSKIVLDTTVFLKQASAEFLLEQDRNSADYGEPMFVRQNGLAGSGWSDPIPLAKCLHYAHGSRNGNPYGRSRFKAAFGPWFAKAALVQDWGRALQRVGSPVPIGTLDDPDQPVIDQNGDTTTAGDVMLTNLEGLQNSSSMVVKTGQKVDFLEPKHPIGPDFKLHEDQRNKLILRALLIPALLMEPTDIGSFALGSKHFELYLRATRREACAFQRVLLRQLIGPLLRWNFGPSVPIGSFVAQEMDEEELKLWADILYSLTQSGYLSSRLQSDMDFARAKMGLPGARVEDMPAPEPVGSGRDGIPGAAPDGQDKAGAAPPRPAPRIPTTPQGRPVGSGTNGRSN